MMPPQLARAKRPKRSTPRPIVETLERLDIRDLCRWRVFPKQTEWHKAHLLELSFRYSFAQSFVISLQNIEVNHYSGYTQSIPLRWLRTGFGGPWEPRPLFICICGRSVTKLYYHSEHLHCRRCCSATYASRVLGKRTRPILQAIRLRNLLSSIARNRREVSDAKRCDAQASISPYQQCIESIELDAVMGPAPSER